LQNRFTLLRIQAIANLLKYPRERVYRERKKMMNAPLQILSPAVAVLLLVEAAGGATHGLFKAAEPGPAFKQFTNRCLKEKGYEPMGWQLQGHSVFSGITGK
jgi:hypothetical protein